MRFACGRPQQTGQGHTITRRIQKILKFNLKPNILNKFPKALKLRALQTLGCGAAVRRWYFEFLDFLIFLFFFDCFGFVWKKTNVWKTINYKKHNEISTPKLVHKTYSQTIKSSKTIPKAFRKFQNHATTKHIQILN